MSPKTPDPVVAQAAIDANAVLITWDRDFGTQTYDAPRYAALNIIRLACPENLAVERLRATIVDVEREWADLRAGHRMRLAMRIGRLEIRLTR